MYAHAFLRHGSYATARAESEDSERPVAKILMPF